MQPAGPLANGTAPGSSSPIGDLPFQTFAEALPALAWIAEPDGLICWFNQRWYEYTGTTPEQMYGWGWKSVHDPVALPRVLALWKNSIDLGEPFDCVFPLRGRDGSFRPFLTRAVPSRDGNGRILHWFGTNIDVSRELDATASLAESEARFRTATEAVNAILWTNDGEGKMTGDQPGWAAFTGQSKDEYEGYGWAQAVHPEDMRSTMEAWQCAVAGRRLFAFEHRVRRADGVFRLCSIRALPVFDENEEVREWVGVHTDITEERAMQDTLHATVAELKQQQELIAAAQLVLLVGFCRLSYNPEELYLDPGSRLLFGYSPSEPLYLADLMQRVHPDDQAKIHASHEEAFRTGKHRVEFRILPTRMHPETRWILAHGFTQLNEAGEPYLVGINLDITQQRRSDEALMRTEKLAVAGRLAASIAHEINNPLEAMTNLVYLLANTPVNEEQRTYVDTLGSELARVSHIATHTLRFHRQSTSSAPVLPSDLIESVLALHQGRLQSAGVKVECRYQASDTLVGLGGDLRQVLANLVGNAVDAMQTTAHPRRLDLRTRSITHPVTGQHGVCITVADRGTGIAAAHLDKIFDPFFTTKPETGTGLGLWVSHQIVAKHRGLLRLRTSQQPRHHGTVFHLFLPLTP